MAESFENLDNILHDWAKDKIQSLVPALNRYQEHSLAGRRNIKRFFCFRKDLEKILEQSQSAVERDS